VADVIQMENARLTHPPLDYHALMGVKTVFAVHAILTESPTTSHMKEIFVAQAMM